MPAEEQVDEVRRELKRRNPDFDESTVEHKVEDGGVVELKFLSDHVTDISPVRALTALQSLDCSGSWGVRYFTYRKSGLSQLDDLSPLRGLQLIRLECNATEVADLTPLNGMPLEHLSLAVTPVKDLSAVDSQLLTHLNLSRTQVNDTTLAHFEGCRNLTWLDLDRNRIGDAGLAHFPLCNNLKWLGLSGTRVTDAGLAHSFRDLSQQTWLGLSNTQIDDAGLAHINGCKLLALLELAGTNVTDLSLLKGIPLKTLTCDFQPDRDAEILRSIKTLETINGKPAAEFWKVVEASQDNDTDEESDKTSD